MTYKIKKEGLPIRILGEKFVMNNKYKAKLIINNKIYDLFDLFPICDLKKNDIIKIKMVFIEKFYQRSYMFQNCDSLLIVSYKNFEGEIKNENTDTMLFDSKFYNYSLKYKNIFRELAINNPNQKRTASIIIKENRNFGVLDGE